MDQKEALWSLQEADLAILRAKTRYDKLPEKAQLADLRDRSHEVLHRAGQVSDLKDECEDAIRKLQDEDAELQESIASKRKALESTTDHRLVGRLTKDVEGAVKRREKVGFQTGELYDRLEKIEQAAAQVSGVSERLDLATSKLEQAVNQAAEQMKATIVSAQERHRAAVAVLDPALLAEYERLFKSKGGIAVARYADERCSACNVELQEGERYQIEQGPDIGVCPRCGRLLLKNLPNDGDGAAS